MKRIVSVLLLFVILTSLVSCRTHHDNSMSVVLAYAEESESAGVVYSSLAKEGEDGYISPSLRAALFGDGELPADFALLIHSRLDTVTELGVFLVENDDEGLQVCELLSERLLLLRTLARGDGETMLVDNLAIYYFGESPEIIKETLMKILN